MEIIAELSKIPIWAQATDIVLITFSAFVFWERNFIHLEKIYYYHAVKRSA